LLLGQGAMNKAQGFVLKKPTVEG